jgi:hypothetical protein
VGDGILRRAAGVVQIRDYASQVNDVELLSALHSVREQLKSIKREYYALLTDPKGLNYFNQLGSDHQVREATHHDGLVVKTSFDCILEKRLALAGTIVSSLKTDSNLGRTKLAKVFYLAEMTGDLNLQTAYRREAAGPLDSRALYHEKIGIEHRAATSGYFTSKQVGRSVKYLPGPSLPDLVKNAFVLFEDKWVDIKRVINTCKTLNTDQCEIVATLYACWNDLILEHKRIDDRLIVVEFLSWHAKKRRFPKSRVENALTWMRAQKLTPRGRGKHTAAKVTADVVSF